MSNCLAQQQSILTMQIAGLKYVFKLINHRLSEIKIKFEIFGYTIYESRIGAGCTFDNQNHDGNLVEFPFSNTFAIRDHYNWDIINQIQKLEIKLLIIDHKINRKILKMTDNEIEIREAQSGMSTDVVCNYRKFRNLDAQE